MSLSKIRLYPLLLCFFFLNFTAVKKKENLQESVYQSAEAVLKEQVLKEAEAALSAAPVTVTSAFSPRSAGGKHDFYSEGDYWWPDPQYPEGPYIQRDGMTNPGNFVAHRLAMIRFSRLVGALTSAYKITGEKKYARAAIRHLKAWFIDPETKMNPNLLYAQAIKGLYTGRGIGIIDTIHLLDVVQGIQVLQKELLPADLEGLKNWFKAYLDWLMTHPNGKTEMNAKNNHGTCFVLQVAAFSKLTGNAELQKFCIERYKTVLLPAQMAADGSFPLELARTKPYGYSLFNLDVMTILCQVLSSPENNLWTYTTADGRSIRKGIEYLYPFVANKSLWGLKPDVMHWEEWPVAQPFLIFGANAYGNKDWLKTWEKLEHQPQGEEVIRNLPIKYPLIWLN
eukprot:gene4777-5564_t